VLLDGEVVAEQPAEVVGTGALAATYVERPARG
jgi:hypothetical protein